MDEEMPEFNETGGKKKGGKRIFGKVTLTQALIIGVLVIVGCFLVLGQCGGGRLEQTLPQDEQAAPEPQATKARAEQPTTTEELEAAQLADLDWIKQIAKELGDHNKFAGECCVRTYHTLQPGDTLESILDRLPESSGLTAELLMQLNPQLEDWNLLNGVEEICISTKLLRACQPPEEQ